VTRQNLVFKISTLGNVRQDIYSVLARKGLSIIKKYGITASYQSVLGSISDHRPTVLTEVFYGIPESFQHLGYMCLLFLPLDLGGFVILY
jgi:hypothetical protein